jgi:hypothetical protein
MEHEIAMRKLGDHLDEQQRAERDYLKLREQYRNSPTPQPVNDPGKTG